MCIRDSTNRERLTDYEPFEAVYTRADSALIESLEASDGYGRLLPFLSLIHI